MRQHRVQIVDYSPDQYVKAANLMAARFAADAPLRTLAAQIVGPGSSMTAGRYPLAIAQWIRANVQYVQEQGEVINGAYHTLPVMKVGPWTIGGSGVGDCDDLVTTWATLVRSLGLRAFLVGVGPGVGRYQHAVGFCDGQFYELTNCPHYGCPETTAMGVAFPRTWRAIGYDPDNRRWFDVSASVPAAPSASMGRLNVSVDDAISAIEGAGVNLQDVAGNVGSNAIIREGAKAAGTVAGAATTATSIAATLGVSAAAVPIIGWAVAGAALIGVGIGALIKRGKVRRKTFRAGLKVNELIDATVNVMRAATPEDAKWIRIRLWQVIPAMAGTGVPLATYDRKKVSAPYAWADGRTGWKDGVAEKIKKKKDEEDVLQRHAATLEAFAQSLASMPLAQRKGAMRLAITQFLGQSAMNETLGRILPEYVPPADSSAGAGASSGAKKAPLWLIPAALIGAAALLAS